MAENQSEATQQGGNQQFAIQKIYIKDVSFESPNSPAMFTKEWQPEVNLDMNTNTQSLSEGVYEVVLSLTATIKNADQTAFLVEIQQAGIFTISGFAENEMGHMLGSFCPNILFPYAREAVSDLVTRGGYPPLILAPVNFDALYAQHMEQQQAGEAASTH
ncbi:MAG: protein-export chaperone SecB [Halobacteria archaeon]|nr:protein-export chaperone SecB [Halobacteria archaeon]